MNHKVIAIIDSIEKSNMSAQDKILLVKLLQENKTDFTGFLLALLKTSGLALDVFEKFGIDIGDLMDKFF